MATVINDRDVRLLGATQRTSNLPESTIILSADAPAFKVSTGGVAFPTSITITANLVRLTGTVVFTASGATITDNHDNTATLNYTGMQGDSVVVTASLNTGGQSYTRSLKLSKIVDGAPGTKGDPGVTGNQYAVAYVYQWAPNTPSKPTGTTLYNWSTGANTGYTDFDNWASTVPANPGTPGVRLYVAAVSITAAGGTASSVVSYGNSVVQAWAQNGSNGSNGVSGIQSATAIVYQWAATIPAGPIGGSTYSWSNGSFDVPSSWVATPTAAPSQNMTLWAARVLVTDSAVNSTTSFNWSTAAIYAAGYSASNGQAGPSGASYVTAYCASATGNATSAPAATTGKSSLPAANSGGIVGTWSATVPTLVAGQYMYQVDGIYDPTTDKITWSIPYWSSLKVGSLSAISANLGQITGGSMNINDKFIVDSSGNVTAKSLTISFGSDTVLAPGVPLADSYVPISAQNSNIRIGGRNLLRDSGFESGLHPCSEKTASVRTVLQIGNVGGTGATAPFDGSKFLFFEGTSTGGDTYLYLGGPAAPVTSGKTYTLSFYYKSAGQVASSSTYFRQSDGYHIYFSSLIFGVQDEWSRAELVWVCPTGVTTLEPRFGFVSTGYAWMAVDCIQIEEGNKATAWTPALEDVNADIIAAQSAADAANSAIANISNDNILSKGEKSELVLRWNTINGEVTGVENQAIALGVSYSAYDSAFTTVRDYLGTISPAWYDTETDSPIDGAAFRQKFSNYYVEKQNLLNAISAKINTSAANAQASADAANTAIANISNDNMLSKGEKPQVILDWNAADREHIPLANQADSIGVNRDAYWTAFTNLANYLPAGWNDTSVDTPIVGADFRTYWNNYYDEKQKLINAMAAKAATVSSWAGVNGSGKPQDNATNGATLGVNVTGTMTNVKDYATNLGTFVSPGTARTQINDLGIRVYDGAGNLRIKIGQL